MTHSWENKYQGRHLVKERSSGHKEWQQGCPNTQRGFVDEKNHSRSDNVEKRQDNEQWQNKRGNSKE